MSTPTRKLAAILAADVVGYSRLMGEDQARTLDALRQLRKELFEPVVEEFRGNVVKRMGDGWIVEFASVSDAVDCAMRFQLGLADHEIIRLRTGIHIGEVVFEDEDVFGEGVNVAARLEELAEPGEVLISDTVHNSLDEKSVRQFSDGDSQDLKNIARPVQVWRWSSAGTQQAIQAETEEALSLSDKPSIAVLPFENMSGDPEQEYFSDGIAEDIITALSKFRWFFVTARNSTFTYKGAAIDIKQVGRELGVRYVLEGSVRKAGSRIRITAQLIEAATGNHIWAERYDRQLDDIFDLQDEMQQAIVAAVEPEMAGAEMDRAVKKAPQMLDAWDLFQQANWHFNQRSLEATDFAEPLYEKVVALDPSFAPAYAMHAWLLHNAVVYGFRTDTEVQLGKGLEIGRTGVLKDDRDALTHFALGRVMTMAGDLTGGIREQRLAVQLNPNFSFAAWGLGEALGRAGHHQEALETIEVALRLSPRDTLRFLFLRFKGHNHDALGQTGAAEAAYREAVALNHHVSIVTPNITLIDFLVRRGRQEEARALMSDLAGAHPELSIAALRSRSQHVWSAFQEGWGDRLVSAGLPEE